MKFFISVGAVEGTAIILTFLTGLVYDIMYTLCIKSQGIRLVRQMVKTKGHQHQERITRMR